MVNTLIVTLFRLAASLFADPFSVCLCIFGLGFGLMLLDGARYAFRRWVDSKLTKKPAETTGMCQACPRRPVAITVISIRMPLPAR